MNVEESIQYYEDRYKPVGQWFITPGEKISLTSQGKKKCRFCGRTESEVSFKLVAHALPEAIGNKSIFSDYECDVCNSKFGSGIENDFGNWSKPMRTLTRICGKKGVPSIKESSAGGWRIDYDQQTGFLIKSYEENPIFEIDFENKEVTFKLRRDSFTPVAVLKAFVKMALTLMPDSEMENFQVAIEWICEKNHEKRLLSSFPVLYAFVPGPMPPSKVAISIFVRKKEVDDVPYAFMILAYGNEVFQVFVPSPERDMSLNGVKLNLFPFPTPYDIDANRVYGKVRRGLLDFTGCEIKKGDISVIKMGFETIAENQVSS